MVSSTRITAGTDETGGEERKMAIVNERDMLQRTLGTPDLAWLVDRIRNRLERGIPLDGTVTLVGATAAQRRAAGRLIGRGIGRGTSLSVSLPALEAALRSAGITCDLRTAVEFLSGPVRDLRAERTADMEARAAAVAAARNSLHAATVWYSVWLDEVARDGTVNSLIRRGEGHLLGQAAAVLDRLPALSDPGDAAAATTATAASGAGDDIGGVLLPALAESVTGDAAALSATVLAGLVLRALAHRDGVAPPVTRADERARWTAAGVVADDLASQVLVLNVRAGGEPLGRWLSEAADRGEPFRVTLHQLSAMPVVPLGMDIFVCENPAVLRAAARELGARCAPLVCTEGEPSAACNRLLHAAARSGSRIHWRNDFDWTGLRRTTAAVRRFDAMPWRMGVDDYRAALDAGEAGRLKGATADSHWDTQLAKEMVQAGRAVMEERLIGALLDDLRADSG
jgi:hypothetical protein